MIDYLVNMDGSWARLEDARKVYYVYVLRRPNGKVFYVGKGKGNRIDVHEREARSTCHCHKCHIIRLAWKRGESIGKEIVYSTNIERNALIYEAQLIQSMREQLVNILDCDGRLSKPQHRYYRPKPRKTQQQKQCERMQRACDMINILSRKVSLAIRYKREHQIEQLEAEIDAYELWIHPPEQMQFEGF